MSLASGTRLGPYEILARIGAGGMGEVYRGRDTKLKRDVALKVLPETFGRDPERVARFEREAEVLASLNHPNIAAIYGVVEDRALVMELVEGAMDFNLTSLYIRPNLGAPRNCEPMLGHVNSALHFTLDSQRLGAVDFSFHEDAFSENCRSVRCFAFERWRSRHTKVLLAWGSG